MTETTDRNRERAEAEAAVWLLRLSEAPNDAELHDRFEAWRAASDLNAEIWARTVRAYDLVGKGPPAHRAQWQAYAATRESARKLPTGQPPAKGVPHARRLQEHRPGRLSSRRLGVGLGAAVLAACLLVAVLPEVLLRVQADLVTTTAELRSTVLEDGTRLQLAPESAVDLRFADGVREVHLIKGEAFLEVDRNPAVPFRVVAGDTVTTVLGTAFEVRHRSDAERIVVRHGRVRVGASGGLPSLSAELRAGEWLRIGAEGETVRGRLLLDDIAAWRNGEVIARDRPVGEIVDVLRRYHSGAILLQNEAFAARRVTGIYSLRNPAETLRDLAASHGAEITQISPWLLIVTGR